MDDAISRSALVNDMKGVVFREKPFGDADVDSLYQSIKNLYSGMIYLVETAPAVDAVPVVRCEECVCCTMWNDQLICSRIRDVMDGYYHGTADVVNPDDYCSHGKRRMAKPHNTKIGR